MFQDAFKILKTGVRDARALRLWGVAAVVTLLAYVAFRAAFLALGLWLRPPEWPDFLEGALVPFRTVFLGWIAAACAHISVSALFFPALAEAAEARIAPEFEAPRTPPPALRGKALSAALWCVVVNAGFSPFYVLLAAPSDMAFFLIVNGLLGAWLLFPMAAERRAAPDGARRMRTRNLWRVAMAGGLAAAACLAPGLVIFGPVLAATFMTVIAHRSEEAP